MPPPAIERVASVIDHTLLDASAGAGAIDELCDEASRHRFASVCVHGRWVARCAGHGRVAAVISFPHGLDATGAKVDATRRAVADGAAEVDVVIAYALLDEDPAAVAQDLEAVVTAVPEATVKAIGAGTGAEFSLLPAQNATGNWVKVTQRIPVRLELTDPDARMALRTGMSASVTVDTGVARGLPKIFGSATAGEATQ